MEPMDYIPRDIPFQLDQVIFAVATAGLWTFVAWGGLSRRVTRVSVGCGCRLQRLRRFSLVTAIASQVLAMVLWWSTGVLFLPTVAASVMLTLLFLGTECRERTVGGVRVHEQQAFGHVLEIVPASASSQGANSN